MGIEQLNLPHQEGPPRSVTIAGGQVTLDGSANYVLDTEAESASDDLETILGGVEGQRIRIRAKWAGRQVVLKNGVGNLTLGSDFTLASTKSVATLQFDGARWLPLSLQTTPETDNDKVYLYRNFAMSGYKAEQYEIYVPYANDQGTQRFAVYGFVFANGIYHMGRLLDGVPVINTRYTSLTQGTPGNWQVTTNEAIFGGDATRTNVAGETISGSVSGHTLLVRGPVLGNGGIALVSIDGDWTAATRLPEVTASDFTNITGAAASPSGEIRITAPGHGLKTGAKVWIENVLGTTEANGLFTVTVRDTSDFDLDGTTFTNSYTSGGTVGLFRQTDIGKRFVEFYTDGSAYFDETIPLVEGLVDGPHTVLLEATGTTRAGGSDGARLYISALQAATAGTKPNDVNASMAYLREITNLRNSVSWSALVSAVEYTPTGFPLNYRFIGENHGNELQDSAIWRVDGVDVALVPGEYRAGVAAQLLAEGEYTHPSIFPVTPIAERSAVYTARVSDGHQIQIEQTIRWLRNGSTRTYYAGMLHVGVRDYLATGGTNTFADRVLVGTTLIDNLAVNDGSNKGAIPANSIEFFHSAEHDVRARLSMPNPALNVNGWVASSPDFAFVEDRNDDLADKGYFSRQSFSNTRTVLVNEEHRSITGYRVWRAL